MPPRKSKLPVPLPEGLIVTDTNKKSWKLGKKLGQGGFGLIYLASPASDLPTRDDAAYVIKVEYHQNGPLFCELKFYQRAAKQEDVAKWISCRKLDYLGIPRYWGSGEKTFNSISYRFMVIDRLGSDLHHFQTSNNGRLPFAATMQTGIRMLDILEYIHEHEYVHGDIKAGNILCHMSDPHKVYLADYGLSYRYCPDGKHKEYKEDPRKCHNGTIEFTSLDAHKGAAPSRRGDLQILSFCMLHWLSGRLPWDQDLKFPSAVQAAKEKLMDELPKSVIAWLGQEDGCHLAKFMAEVSTLKYDVTPNYDRLKGILLNALESAGTRLSAPLTFSNGKSVQRKLAAARTEPETLKPHQNMANKEDDRDLRTGRCDSPKLSHFQRTSKIVQNKKVNGMDSGFQKGEDRTDLSVSSLQRRVEDDLGRRFEEDLRPDTFSIHKPKGIVHLRNIQNYRQAKTPLSNNHTDIPEREAPSTEPNPTGNVRQDIYKYGVAIPLLLLLIFYSIYCL